MVGKNVPGFEIVLILLCAVMSSQHAFSQETLKDVGGAPPVSARAAVLGDAYVAEATDAGDAFGNPATPIFLSGPSVSLGHSLERKDVMMRENMAIAFPFTQTRALGIGVSVAHTGYLEDSPRTTTEMKILQYLFDIGYAQRISPSLGVGVSLGLRYANSEGYHSTELNPSVGVIYAPSPEVSYGLVYSDRGSFLEYTHDSSSVSWNTGDLRRSLQIGLTLRLRLWRRDPTLTMALANEKILSVGGLTYKGGAEFRPSQYVAFRMGYFVTPDKAYARYGVGLILKPLRIDYSISPSYFSDRFHDMTASWDF
jgi:hypothetical protein